MRAVFTVLLFLSVLVAPWWVPSLIALVLVVRYRAYEVPIAGVLMDILYGIPQGYFYGYLLTIVGVLIFVCAELLKRELLLS